MDNSHCISVSLASLNFQETTKKLENAGIFEPLNVVRLHPFRVQKKMQELGASRQHPWAFQPLSKLGKLARAMGYLVYSLSKQRFIFTELILLDGSKLEDVLHMLEGGSRSS